MAAAFAKWRDHRTPPAGPEDAASPPAGPQIVSVTEPLTVTDDSVTEASSVTRCAECNEPFAPQRATARFCSPACRQKAHRRTEVPA
jgi:hypothetical protein